MNDISNSSRAHIERHVLPGMTATILHRPACREVFVTVSHTPGEPAALTFGKAAGILRDLGARPAAAEVFGFAHEEFAAETGRALGDATLPLTWIEDGPEAGEAAAGIEVWGVAGAEVTPVIVDGVRLGSVFDNGATRVCRLGGLLPPSVDCSCEDQTRAVFAMMKAGVEAAGMKFSNVLRTWFHNHDILDWYGEFNQVRDVFFRENQVFRGIVPASTGVAGRNPKNAALTAGLVAFRPQVEGIEAAPLASPLQCPALDYGSSFSRAVEVAYPDHRRVFVSGTASIEPGGKTVHLDNMEGQVKLTFDVVHAIIAARGMDWNDVNRGIAYVKHAQDIPVFERYLRQSAAASAPFIVAHNDICRGDLLFEIEVDAIAC